MSKLDDVLTGYVAASKDAQREGMIDREDVAEVVDAVKAARSELAALRRRAEDAEAMLRGFVSMTITKSGPFGLGGAWLIWDGCLSKPPTILPMDDATGLPVLTDEAREALKT